MRLISLRLHQWRSFEDAAFDFPDGLIGVRGPNGVGKTTLAEAIGWALFGKPRGGGRIPELRRQGAPRRDASSVELVFQLDTTVYRIERVVGKDAKLWINDQLESTKVTDTNARIRQELDLSWEVFERTVFAQQKDVAALAPTVTKDQRRAHVERLLGLSRFGEAAKRARGEARALEQQLAGQRAVAPDLRAIDDELRQAERDAARDDPKVAQAEQDCAKADETRNAAKAALEAERERASRAHTLAKDLEHAGELAARAEAVVAKLETRLEARERRRRRLAEVAREVAKFPEAEAAASRWDEFADSVRELDEVDQELAAISFDPEQAATNAERLEALRKECAHLGGERSEAQLEFDRASARLAALREAADAGAPSEHEARRKEIERERETLSKELAILRSELESDRAHVEEVEKGGPDTPCPVCRKPYGAEYDTIVAGYRERIASGDRRVPEIEVHVASLDKERSQLEKVIARSRRAEERLSETAGAASVKRGEAELAAIHAELKRIQERLAAIEEELPPLEIKVREDAKVGRRFERQAAVRDDREKRRARAAAALGIDAYDTDEHEKARTARDELRALAAEVTQLQADVAAEANIEEEIESGRREAVGAREKERSLKTELEELAFEPARLEDLRRAYDDAEQVRDGAREHLHRAQIEAQERSQKVQELRRRREEARLAKVEIERGEIEVRRHQVAAELLDKYRAYQNQRAWPWLEQGASALLAATTDGRYADVRLDEEYRIRIVDRGETHAITRYSGGEQDLANLCLRLAIADWVARQRGVEIGFVVLDEVFGSQDEERRQRLLSELRGLSNRFRQVLVITHLPEIADLCDHQLEVRLEQPGTSLAAFAG
jgi:exonuclease SbcC